MKRAYLWLALGLMLFTSTLFAQGAKNITSLGTYPRESVGKVGKNPDWGLWQNWNVWTNDKSEDKIKLRYLPNGGPKGKPALEIVYDGEGQWGVISDHLALSSDRGTVRGLFPVRCFENSVRVNVAAMSKQPHSGRVAGGIQSIEPNDWVPLLASVELVGAQAVTFTIAGNGKGRALLGLIDVAQGEGFAPGERPKVKGYAQSLKEEKLDREFVALEGKKGVYLGWRLLKNDPDGIAFNLYRRKESEENAVKITKTPIIKTSDFQDELVTPGKWVWQLRPVVDNRETGEKAEVAFEVTNTSGERRNYVSIPLSPNCQPHTVAVGDLDGDGALDFVVKQPRFNTDPYHKEKYWKKSRETYKLEAYTSKGRHLWTYDLGWAIEEGIWYSPVLVYDLDGDGRAEVVTKTGVGDPRDEKGRVHSDREFVTVLDGLSGKVVTQAPWVARAGFPYNFASRNFLGLAYLDGKTPFLIVHRGTYSVMRMAAYQLVNGKLEKKLEWTNEFGPISSWGQGAHRLHAADVDQDGREELCIGSFVLDDDGTILWALGLGHPDFMYVGDLNPKYPGMEIYYGLESRNKKNGMCMVHAATGEYIWGYDRPTWHIHGSGLCADLDARYPGHECFGGEAKNEHSEDRFYWTADGKLLARGLTEKEVGVPGLGNQTLYWDATPQRAIIRGDAKQGFLMKLEFPKKSYITPSFSGHFLMTGDLFGDWREEIVTAHPGELRIYSTTIPAINRRVCLLQDRNYRATITENSVGYKSTPILSYDMMTTEPTK